jgi:hypothetical protein
MTLFYGKGILDNVIILVIVIRNNLDQSDPNKLRHLCF